MQPARSRSPDVVLGELAATPFGIETHHEAVVIDPNDRAVGSLAITGGACRYNDVAVDGNRSVLRRRCAGRITGRSPIRIGLAQPRRDDRLPTDDRVVIGVIPVGDVLGEERCDIIRVVGQPGRTVSVEPGWASVRSTQRP
jgi:hypothetical protein